jgi:hypothetical protein
MRRTRRRGWPRARPYARRAGVLLSESMPRKEPQTTPTIVGRSRSTDAVSTRRRKSISGLQG